MLLLCFLYLYVQIEKIIISVSGIWLSVRISGDCGDSFFFSSSLLNPYYNIEMDRMFSKRKLSRKVGT